VLLEAAERGFWCRIAVMSFFTRLVDQPLDWWKHAGAMKALVHSHRPWKNTSAAPTLKGRGLIRTLWYNMVAAQGNQAKDGVAAERPLHDMPSASNAGQRTANGIGVGSGTLYVMKSQKDELTCK
jgi:hypothetical protein